MSRQAGSAVNALVIFLVFVAIGTALGWVTAEHLHSETDFFTRGY